MPPPSLFQIRLFPPAYQHGYLPSPKTNQQTQKLVLVPSPLCSPGLAHSDGPGKSQATAPPPVPRSVCPPPCSSYPSSPPPNTTHWSVATGVWATQGRVLPVLLHPGEVCAPSICQVGEPLLGSELVSDLLSQHSASQVPSCKCPPGGSHFRICTHLGSRCKPGLPSSLGSLLLLIHVQGLAPLSPEPET